MKCLPGSALALVCLQLVLQTSNAVKSPWRYECVQGHCEKRANTNLTQSTALSLSACRIFCSDVGAVWPKPTGEVSVGNVLSTININSIDVLGTQSESTISDLVAGAAKIFRQQIEKLVPRNFSPNGGKSLVVTLDIKDQTKDALSLDLDESYTLKIGESADGRVQALIVASTFFGARHGLETLNQLIVFDDLREELQIARDVLVTDRPAYPYRGVLVDTSRNFISGLRNPGKFLIIAPLSERRAADQESLSPFLVCPTEPLPPTGLILIRTQLQVDAIKTTINAMGASKLNTFHWHITDSHSFPYVSKSQPELSLYGAYSADKVYTPEDISEIIKYAKQRGVRVLPEFDAPAHVGEGWQNTGLVTCFNWQPWQKYCVEPPCGQFDVTKPELYDVIGDIYNDMFDQFQPDIFHMGGDEVNFNCWNSTQSIVDWMGKKGWGRTESDFIKLWNYFQTQALERVYKKAGKPIPVIMWTSHLTHKEYLISSLPKDKYIVQIWTLGTDEQVKNLIQNGYQVILSNYDALYLDCGFAGWVTDGNNWCSPYIGWQKVYENKPRKITGDKRKQVLGAEATFWTEQADSTSLDSRLWPRASAMAEVLWSEPETSWRAAESRILIHRERLVKLGINADALEPEWCLQHEENCPIGGKFNIDNRA